MESLANLSILFTIIIFLSFVNDKKRILMIMTLISFPLVIKVLGKDALTISTILIYIFSIFYLIKIRNHIKVDLIIILSIIIIAIGAFSTFSVPSSMTGHAVRKYSDFVSSIMFFLYIYYQHISIGTYDEEREYFEKFISIYVIIISIQIIISLILTNFSISKQIFSYFTFSNINEFSGFYKQASGIERMQSLIYTYEDLGETLAVISPIVLYKCFNTQKIIWLFIYIFLFIGLLYTKTRSGILLFIFSSLIFPVFNIKELRLKSLISIIVFGTTFVTLLITFFDSIYTDSLMRLTESNKYFQSGKILEAMNRRGLIENFKYVLNEANLFGRGLVSITQYTGGTHFHCLYQTIIFQFGIIGSSFYFLILITIFLNLIKTFFRFFLTSERILTFSLSLSFSIFLINEIKYEFNRAEGYQQLTWALFASYMMITKSLNRNVRKIKNKNN